MLRKRATRIACLVVLCAVAVPSAPTRAAAPIFRFESDEFWLNLHHFLYVLGRAQAKTGDAGRDAVVDAPTESEAALQSLSDAERRTWADAIAAYATGFSRKDLVFDDDAADLTARLARADSAGGLAGIEGDASVRAVLERAAPVYRKAWWPAHRASNRAWVAAVQRLVDQHGQTVLAFVTRVYGMRWPADGYAVHAVRYANWAGAYSKDNFLVASTNPRAGLGGYAGLETAFHEGMHTWDDAMNVVIAAQARQAGRLVPRNFSHALIFYTAGDAIRRVAPPGYVAAADASGAWSRGMPFKPALQELWQPYLDGRGTRDQAIAALLTRVGAEVRKTGSPIFTFSTDEFWVNLHHFLYVLGRAQANQPDASRRAVAGAVPDMQRGLSMLSADERAVWSEVTTMYAANWSLANPDAGTIRVLINLGDVPTLMASAGMDPMLRAALDRAAPIYRRVWWPSHRDANRQWVSSVQALLERHGEAVLAFLTRAYNIDWPVTGRPVSVAAYANFGGAYSLTNGGVIVVASAAPDNEGLSGLESVFHEGLHQWDNETFAALATQARAAKVAVPGDLPHAMIFFTAGEAVKRVVPGYTPYADRVGIWELMLSGSQLPAGRLRQPLIDTWKPFLDGGVDRDAALRALVVKAAAASR